MYILFDIKMFDHGVENYMVDFWLCIVKYFNIVEEISFDTTSSSG